MSLVAIFLPVLVVLALVLLGVGDDRPLATRTATPPGCARFACTADLTEQRAGLAPRSDVWGAIAPQTSDLSARGVSGSVDHTGTGAGA